MFYFIYRGSKEAEMKFQVNLVHIMLETGKSEPEKVQEELTLQNVPKAVNYLINEIAEMRVLLEHIEKQLGLGVDKHRPIGIEDACRILGQTKGKINKMVRNATIPHYVRNKKVYFFEDELVKWVEDARVALCNEKYAGKFLRR